MSLPSRSSTDGPPSTPLPPAVDRQCTIARKMVAGSAEDILNGPRAHDALMLELLFAPRWSPYLAGAGIGVLMILAFVLANRPIGCSTAYLKASGMLGRLVAPERTGATEYYRRFTPTIDWQFMIVPGIIIGAFLAAWLSGTFRIEVIPGFWADRIGTSVALRWAVGLAGGILLGFGARWAGGCTSGHGIGGNIQLSIASMLASAGFFIGGILVALSLFGIPWGLGVWGLAGGGP